MSLVENVVLLSVFLNESMFFVGDFNAVVVVVELLSVLSKTASSSSHEQHPHEVFPAKFSVFILLDCRAFSDNNSEISSLNFLLARSAFKSFRTNPLTSM